MIQTEAPLDCILWLDHGANGASEIHHLYERNWGLATLQVLELAEARSWLLGKNCRVKQAALRSVADPPIQQVLLPAPLTALPQWEVVDNDFVTLLWCFDTGTGKTVNRHFRLVADGEISDQRWLRKPFPLPGALPPRPLVPALATKEDLWKYVLCLFRARTCFRDDEPDLSGPVPLWRLRPWEDALFNRVSSLPIGRASLPISWEPVDQAAGPPFSPCGTIVGMMRDCYEADCTFLLGGPDQPVRYYFAKNGANLLPWPTIFWGWATDKKIGNVGAVGEWIGPGARVYSFGYSAGDAPGVAPTGTREDFLGQTPLFWAPPYPTPILNRPGCDMPLAPPIVIDNDDLSVVDPSAYHLTIGTGLVLTHVSPHHDHIDAIGAVDDGITVEAADGDPTFPGTHSLEFSEADGFKLTQPGAGEALVELLDADCNNPGKVSTGFQVFYGEKAFVDLDHSVVNVGNPYPSSDPNIGVYESFSEFNLFAGQASTTSGHTPRMAVVQSMNEFARAFHVSLYCCSTDTYVTDDLNYLCSYYLTSDELNDGAGPQDSLFVMDDCTPAVSHDDPIDWGGGHMHSVGEWFVGTPHIRGDSGYLADGTIVIRGLVARIGLTGGTMNNNPPPYLYDVDKLRALVGSGTGLTSADIARILASAAAAGF